MQRAAHFFFVNLPKSIDSAMAGGAAPAAEAESRFVLPVLLLDTLTVESDALPAADDDDEEDAESAASVCKLCCAMNACTCAITAACCSALMDRM